MTRISPCKELVEVREKRIELFKDILSDYEDEIDARDNKINELEEELDRFRETMEENK